MVGVEWKALCVVGVFGVVGGGVCARACGGCGSPRLPLFKWTRWMDVVRMGCSVVVVVAVVGA